MLLSGIAVGVQKRTSRVIRTAACRQQQLAAAPPRDRSRKHEAAMPVLRLLLRLLAPAGLQTVWSAVNHGEDTAIRRALAHVRRYFSGNAQDSRGFLLKNRCNEEQHQRRRCQFSTVKMNAVNLQDATDTPALSTCKRRWRRDRKPKELSANHHLLSGASSACTGNAITGSKTARRQFLFLTTPYRAPCQRSLTPAY